MENKIIPFPLGQSLVFLYYSGMKAEIFSSLNRYYTWEKFGKPAGRKETDEECIMNFSLFGGFADYHKRFFEAHNISPHLRVA